MMMMIDDCFLVGAAFVSLFTATKHEKKMMKNVYEKKTRRRKKRRDARATGFYVPRTTKAYVITRQFLLLSI